MEALADFPKPRCGALRILALAGQPHGAARSHWKTSTISPGERIGYNHLDAAEEQGQEILTTSLNTIAGQITPEPARQGELAVTVFNPCAWERTGLATTGRIYPIPENTNDIVCATARAAWCLRRSSRAKRTKQEICLSLTWLSSPPNVPSVGYDTYYLDFLPQSAAPPATDLRIDEQQLTMENQFVKVTLSPKFGAIISLVDKRTGREMLHDANGRLPFVQGRTQSGL